MHHSHAAPICVRPSSDLQSGSYVIPHIEALWSAIYEFRYNSYISSMVVFGPTNPLQACSYM
ncbi:hypothetical protein KIN20_030326 [Parelaphostrongylus tenuis]|uniref:Uncharacterized protein n=1 Tax=Parelaphostrongylus tenuis TaxID=148309 RepID=A0AAD5WG23_PARTN|nr:hypothetical protein KIN20_030326 [Parelaphostrongylus tenuis]